MSPDVGSVRADVAAAARRLAGAGLLVGTAGNVSARSGDLVAVTGTGIALGACVPDDVAVVGLDGSPVDGPAPTSELALHLGIYADSAEAGAVVHTHAPYATALSCVVEELPVIHYQQLLLGGALRVAPYATFGTVALADSVRAALAGRSAALMASHGSVAAGSSLDAAVENALLLEWLCELFHRASALGAPRVLSAAEQEDVIRVAIERNYGQKEQG